MPEPQKYKLMARQKRILSDYQQRQHTSAQTVEPSVSTIDSIESIYKSLNDRDEIKAKALLMLMLRNWLTEVSSFDPVSGYALHTGIIDFLDAVAKSVQNESPESEIKDRIYRIVSHTKEAVLAIMEHTRDKILREHAMLPIHAAREVDSNSVQWLNRQPGRTLREKLSGKNYMKAVRRRPSVDTAENRLLRAFLFRLEQILIERQNALSAATEEICDELLVSIQRWLRTEDAAEIGAWGNLPPNNTLLQDKHYRKVWDGWLWLQSIDEQIIGDSKRTHQDILSVIYWDTLSLLNHSGCFRIVQQPVGLDYDNFSILSELPVCGYLFPVCDSKTKGKIKFINPDKSFGFITSDDGRDLYFSPHNLSREFEINLLSAGNKVSFIVSSNQQGEYANDITFTADVKPVAFILSKNNWEIQVGEDRYLLQIVSDNLVIQQSRDTKKKLKIEPAALKEISKTILSLIMNSSFKYSELINNQIDQVRMDSSVVDICSIRPIFMNKIGSQVHLPFRLLQQTWKLKDGSNHVVDCGSTKAIELHPDIETISMRSLFSHSFTLADATKNSASMFFIKKLSNNIKSNKLTYIVPDWGNDFDLEGIRKSVNFYFDASTPLPKSIAVIFAWQASKKFVQDKVREHDFVLVIDSFDGGISVTPVQAIYQKELDEIFPETQGMSWERHPTVILPDRSIHTAMARNLDHNGCQTAEDIIQLFGFDGLISDAGGISFVKDDHWYHLPASIREILTQDLDLNILSNRVISDCLNSTNRDCRGVNIFILPLEHTIRKPDLRKEYKWLGSSWSPIKGGQTLNKWQQHVGNIALWRDHLPELSIRIVRDGQFENFYLVKDATVTPLRGRAVEIPVEELFTLPAGQMYYSFPLQQGENNKKLQFVAYLKSPAFPLTEAKVCRLKMSYTYGADDPYELKFIPLDSVKAGFKSIRVEWRSVLESETTDIKSLPIPDFPVSKTWHDFQRFSNEGDNNFSDLLEWVERDMKKISDLSCFFAGESSNRICVDKVIDYWNWKKDRSGKLFCYLSYDVGEVFFHESSFEKFDPNAEKISFDLERQRGREGYVARNVTLGKSIPKKMVESFKKSLRFPVLTIWNHGHSLSEPDVPDHFRNSILEGTRNVLSIIDSENTPDTLKEELFFFLCCLHKDAPEIVGIRLLDAVKDKMLLRRHHRNIAFAIGNAELSWQQMLLKNIVNPIDNEGITRSIIMEVLSIAFWRSKELIHKIATEEFETLNENLYGCIELDLQKIVIDKKGYQIAILCKHLELLLALLRGRDSEDERFRTILAPNNELTKKYVALVDRVTKIVRGNDMELKSRIRLQIDKPEMFHNTPDLLYALRIYLTGDSGANAIVITNVGDEG